MPENENPVTRIVFSSGADVSVEREPNEVRRLLSADKLQHQEPFTQFKTVSGADVYVAVDQVAYFEATSRASWRPGA